VLEALVEALAEQLHNPNDTTPIVEAMRALYRLLAYAAGEGALQDAYAQAGAMQAHIAMLRAAYAREESEGRIAALREALWAMQTPVYASSPLLQRLQRLNALWRKRLALRPPVLTPIPLLVLKLWATPVR
jgi:hypothetical protein